MIGSPKVAEGWFFASPEYSVKSHDSPQRQLALKLFNQFLFDESELTGDGGQLKRQCATQHSNGQKLLTVPRQKTLHNPLHFLYLTTPYSTVHELIGNLCVAVLSDL